jgi:hypothetical protein
MFSKGESSSMKPFRDRDSHADGQIPAIPASQAGMLTQAEAALVLRVEPRTLEGWRRHRTGPRYFRYSGRCVRYRSDDLKEWLDGRAVNTVPQR